MNSRHDKKFASIENVQQGFKDAEYICNKKIATTVYLAYHLEKPILVEGPAGVGKPNWLKLRQPFLASL